MLSVKNISMHFGGLVALNNVNMTVKEGEIRGLIGPNGSGKTTLINVITGFYAPTKGTVEMGENVISGRRQIRWQKQDCVGPFKTSIFSLR